MNIVITGSTKGLGKALAQEFLHDGHNLIICSRNEQMVKKILEENSTKYPNAKCYGISCDVSDPQEIEKLRIFAQEKLNEIDIWINNAGISGNENKNLVEATPSILIEVANTILVGMLLGTQAALKIMVPQNHGKIFNIEGIGSRGRISPKISAYGAAKGGILQFTKTITQELKGTMVGIHTLSPGMVLTDLILKKADPSHYPIFNILAEQPETVAKFLVPRIKKIKGSGKSIRFLTTLKILWRFLTAKKRKNRFFNLNDEKSDKKINESKPPN